MAKKNFKWPICVAIGFGTKLFAISLHHSHFLTATLDFTSFLQWPSGHTLFIQLGCFGLDFPVIAYRVASI